jgi:hypothetical protein
MPRTLEKRRSVPSAVHFNYIIGRLGHFLMMSETFIAKFTYSFFCLSADYRYDLAFVIDPAKAVMRRKVNKWSHHRILMGV